jgi:hypothetical protein
MAATLDLHTRGWHVVTPQLDTAVVFLAMPDPDNSIRSLSLVCRFNV